MEYDAYRDRIARRSVGRFDTTALATDAETFDAVTRDLATPFEDLEGPIDAVAGIDAIGFVFGAAVARRLEVAFVPIRKGGKLPLAEDDLATGSATDYTGAEKRLELDRQAVEEGDRVALVDDWIETAAQMGVAVDLVERAGADVAGVSVLDAEETPTARELDERYGLHTLNPDRF